MHGTRLLASDRHTAMAARMQEDQLIIRAFVPSLSFGAGPEWTARIIVRRNSNCMHADC